MGQLSVNGQSPRCWSGHTGLCRPSLLSPSHLLGFSPSLRPLSLLTVFCCPLETQQCPVPLPTCSHLATPGPVSSASQRASYFSPPQLQLVQQPLPLSGTTATASSWPSCLRHDPFMIPHLCHSSQKGPSKSVPQPMVPITLGMRSAFLPTGSGSSAAAPTSRRRRPSMHALGADPQTHRLAPALVRPLPLPFPPQSPASANSS